MYEEHKIYTLNYPYGDAVSIAGSMSNLYNCHAFALNFKGIQPPTNVSVWINDPTIYFTDGSLIEIDIENVKNGDIIAYYNEYSNLTHTGVVTDSTTKTLIGLKIRSKDGNGLLLEHSPRGCDYYKGDDSEMKFYCWNHRVGTISSYNDTVHYYQCSSCNDDTYESHNAQYIKIENAFSHLLSCVQCSYSVNEAHHYIQVGAKYRCVACKYVSSFKPLTSMSRSTSGVLFICSYDVTQTPRTYSEMITYLRVNNYNDLLIEFNDFYNDMFK